jgi:malonyl-CoA decarboxylase
MGAGSLALSGKPSFLSGILSALFERGRANARPSPRAEGRRARTRGPAADLPTLCARLISDQHGEASSVALAGEILIRWSALDKQGQLDFLTALGSGFGPDMTRVERAIDAYRANPDAETATALHHAAEPARQEVMRRLNLAPLGALTLVRMREAALPHLAEHAELRALDADFLHLFSSWFNRGFLVLRRIDWSSPANVLEKIIRYEAVHAIGDWGELRRRLQPSDRRCFAFFHPALVDEPLIFVEVALTHGRPTHIGAVLAEDRAPVMGAEADTAVFYSISNCQAGLRGISFGDFLIKQVVDELRRDLPNLETFVTLSPVPGFAAWLAQELNTPGGLLDDQAKAALAPVSSGRDWVHDPALAETIQPYLLRAAALYLARAKTPKGKPCDPVARFHLGNGASLRQLNFLADPSPRGLREAHGLMVNYEYRLEDIEANHERLVHEGHVAASPDVERLLAAIKPSSAARKRS